MWYNVYTVAVTNRGRDVFPAQKVARYGAAFLVSVLCGLRKDHTTLRGGCQEDFSTGFDIFLNGTRDFSVERVLGTRGRCQEDFLIGFDILLDGTRDFSVERVLGTREGDIFGDVFAAKLAACATTSSAFFFFHSSRSSFLRFSSSCISIRRNSAAAFITSLGWYIFPLAIRVSRSMIAVSICAAPSFFFFFYFYYIRNVNTFDSQREPRAPQARIANAVLLAVQGGRPVPGRSGEGAPRKGRRRK